MRSFSGRTLGTVLLLTSSCARPTSEPVGHHAESIAWVPAGSMSVTRMRSPFVAALPGGGALVAGGDGVTKAAELFDAGTKSFSSAGTTDVPVASDALIVSGKVFLGIGTRGQLWDPTSKTFSAIPSDDKEMSGQRHVLLDDGKVMRIGGRLSIGSPPYVSDCEIWDPALGPPGLPSAWSATGSLATGRGAHAAVKLPDGKVLVAGGYGGSGAGLLSTAEIYDPGTKTWSSAGALSTVRTDFGMVLDASGKAIAIGGRSDEVARYEGSGVWTKVGTLSADRYGHAVVVSGGIAYAIGGYDDDTYDAINLTTLSVTKGSVKMSVPRQYPGAAALADGRILVVGGETNETATEGYSSAELLDVGAIPTDAGVDTGTSDAKSDGSQTPIDAGNRGTPTVTGSFQECRAASDCASGFCVDGVCCDQKCDGPCRSCALPNSPGKCSFQPLGLDLRAECGAARSCIGTCGGDGTCVAARAGATCAPSHCSGRSTGVGPVACTAEKSACNDAAAVPFECAPYACESAFGACRSFCTDTSQCADGATCDVASQRCVANAPIDDSGGCAIGKKSAGAFTALTLALAIASARRRRRA